MVSFISFPLVFKLANTVDPEGKWTRRRRKEGREREKPKAAKLSDLFIGILVFEYLNDSCACFSSPYVIVPCFVQRFRATLS